MENSEESLKFHESENAFVVSAMIKTEVFFQINFYRKFKLQIILLCNL